MKSKNMKWRLTVGDAEKCRKMVRERSTTKT